MAAYQMGNRYICLKKIQNIKIKWCSESFTTYNNANKRNLAHIMQTLTQTQQNVLNAIQAIIDNPTDENMESQVEALTQEERAKLVEIASLVAASRQ